MPVITNLNGTDFDVTYGDGKGSLIDWSGETGVTVCFTCGTQCGPWYSFEETRRGAEGHINQHHRWRDQKGQQHLDVTPEAIAKSKVTACIDCGKDKLRNKGLCSGCSERRIFKRLDEQGLLEPGEKLTTYRKRLERDYNSPQWANRKPEPKPPTCRKKVCSNAPVQDGYCAEHVPVVRPECEAPACMVKPQHGQRYCTKHRRHWDAKEQAS